MTKHEKKTSYPEISQMLTVSDILERKVDHHVVCKEEWKT